ncbi:hypothetical protein GCM10010116_31900 [Microbispora rosea subsp. aerata]|nr:SelB C-terminal domain-containing protein [Microbispora rosea]GGO15869.1 hypothetical protein GCM10010116_31900 [Microbispora rosea subsp. aerata]GIH55795.1 hypothetical protein Mro02_27090 [Microbispora rosea subsp. aerata]GLJ83292.1 hypothetical protein GCM10017588_20190 [Microbispora rosea subsp. aerata]
MAPRTHVVATAGHVDHGKSTLVRALTGMEPDRLAEERRRGLTIELGYAWTALPSGDRVAFVDVPGHERFLGTMLAGVGPVPAVLFVVAVRAGALLRVGDGVVLAPGADRRAAALLARLPQPFTVSQAKAALGTSRRVAVPLLEHLGREGLTERVDEVHRRTV